MDCKLQDWLKGWVHSLQKAYADVAQLAEQLICNQQVTGSSPVVGFMGGFPSGQRGQTVNLLQIASVVRIHLHPFTKELISWAFVVTAFNLYNAG